MIRYKIIANPTSGRGAGEQSIPLIQNQLNQYKMNYDIIRTEKPQHAINLAEQAVKDGYDIIVSVGGDGTANEVLNGIMNANQKGVGSSVMGIISVGRGNDFGYGANIPKGVDAACKTLLDDYRMKIDVGKATGGNYPEGRYFGNGVGIGFDAVVGFEAQKIKKIQGFLNYMVAALKTMFLYYNAPLLSLEYNGNTITQNCLLVSVMNGRRMGGGFMMAPEASNHDGLFDLCIGGKLTRPGILALIPRFMKGTQASHPKIITGRTNKLTVKAINGSLPAHADGETLCTEGKELVLEILPQQLEIICQPYE